MLRSCFHKERLSIVALSVQPLLFLLILDGIMSKQALHPELVSFETFVSDERIIRQLVKERVKCAKRFDCVIDKLCIKLSLAEDSEVPQYHKSLVELKNSGKLQSDPIACQLAPLMPPRQQWRNRREKQGNKYKCMKKQLRACIRKARNAAVKPSWLMNLEAFIDEMHGMISSDQHFTVSGLEVNCLPKKKGSLVCRPICSYNDLKTKVMLAMLTDYLKNLCDPYFHTELLSYRLPRNYHGKNVVTDNHDALHRIVGFAESQNNAKKSIYVAECDIQKFFDIINHDVIKSCLREMMDGIKKDHPELDVRRAVSLFDDFVDSFSFNDQVKCLNGKREYWESHLKRPYDAAHPFRFEWVSEPDFVGCYGAERWEAERGRLGVPQGAAPSSFIANLVMNSVDRAVVDESDEERLFVRYCDDIILMHTDHDKCKELYEAYKQSLAEHKLIYHTVMEVDALRKIPFAKNKFSRTCGNYKAYWDSKSKDVFRWGRDGKHHWGFDKASCWIGFLGFEVKRKHVAETPGSDQQRVMCDVRVRRNSIGKRQDKLYEKFVRALALKRRAEKEGDEERAGAKALETFDKIRIDIPMSGVDNNLLGCYRGINSNRSTDRQIAVLKKKMIELSNRLK